ncbi:hypothetical protein ABW21_db0200021 [Orbilia brochopaga]|nr:hypothetical protein ABW21_db0200021 [Drechslerella brochopaga]
MLKMLLPPADYGRVKGFLFGVEGGASRINRLENMLTLRTDHHRNFGAGLFVLEPLRETITATGYQARFRLLPALRPDSKLFKIDRQARTIPVEIPELLPKDEDPDVREVVVVNPTTRQFLEDGDVIAFSTTDPTEFPLPNPDLLDLHNILSRIARMAGRGLIEAEAFEDDDMGEGPSVLAAAFEDLMIEEPQSSGGVLAEKPSLPATHYEVQMSGQDALKTYGSSGLETETGTGAAKVEEQSTATASSSPLQKLGLRKENRQQ